MLVPDDHLWNSAREMVMSRVYERPGWFMFDDLRSCTVIDAGAHVGFFSVMAACYAKQVVAVEADPINARILELNAARNGMGNIRVLNRAVWSTELDLALVPGGGRSGSGSVAEIEAPSYGHVRSIGIQDLLDSTPEASVLKLDIEGAELAVLPAIHDFGSVETIVGELHMPVQAPEIRSVISCLEAAGFETEVVSEAYFYSAEMLRRARLNRRRLKGQWLTKLLVEPYFLAATVSRSRGGNLPGLFARRRTASSSGVATTRFDAARANA